LIFWIPITNPLIYLWNATIKEIYYQCLLIMTELTFVYTTLEFLYIRVYFHHASPHWQCITNNLATIHTTKNPKFIQGMALRSKLSRFIQSIWATKHFPTQCNITPNLSSKNLNLADLWIKMLWTSFWTVDAKFT
jgi:hypothetical protein